MKSNILKPHRIPTYATLVALTIGASANAAIVVEENFGGSAAATLNATTADTFASGITSAGGSSTWAASDFFKADGSLAAVPSDSAYLNMGSYINDAKGTATGLFTLSATVSKVTGASWSGFGFFESNTPATTESFTNGSSAGAGVIIYRSTNSELDGFAGSGTANGVDGSALGTFSGNQLLTIALDLTTAGGYNGTDNFGTITFYQGTTSGTSLGSHTYTSNLSFGSIGLTASGDFATGTMSGFKLEQVAIPEPSSTALLGLAGLALILRRRR